MHTSHTDYRVEIPYTIENGEIYKQSGVTNLSTFHCTCHEEKMGNAKSSSNPKSGNIADGPSLESKIRVCYSFFLYPLNTLGATIASDTERYNNIS